MPVESFIFVKHASTGMKPENNEILSLPFLFAENAERIFVALADREISLKNSGNGKKPLLNPPSVLQRWRSILIFADSKYSRNSLRRANATNFSFDLVKRVTPRGTKTVAGNGRFSGPAYERKQETNGPRHSRD